MFEISGIVYHAYWDDYSDWEGNEYYEDLPSAKVGAEEYFMYEEYGYDWREFLDEYPVLTWDERGKYFWYLSINGELTQVGIQSYPVHKLKES